MVLSTFDSAPMDSNAAAMCSHVPTTCIWSRAMIGRGEGGVRKEASAADDPHAASLVAAWHVVVCASLLVESRGSKHGRFVASPIFTALDLGRRERSTPTPVGLHGESCNLQRAIDVGPPPCCLTWLLAWSSLWHRRAASPTSPKCLVGYQPGGQQDMFSLRTPPAPPPFAPPGKKDWNTRPRR